MAAIVFDAELGTVRKLSLYLILLHLFRFGAWKFSFSRFIIGKSVSKHISVCCPTKLDEQFAVLFITYLRYECNGRVLPWGITDPLHGRKPAKMTQNMRWGKITQALNGSAMLLSETMAKDRLNI